jgi:hypothetical protein
MLLAPTRNMNTNDYAKIGKLVAGGALVAVGLWRRSLFGVLLMGVGGLVLKRTLRTTNDEKAGKNEPDGEVFAKKVPSPEVTAVHAADLDSISEADTLDSNTQQPAQKP